MVLPYGQESDEEDQTDEMDDETSVVHHMGLMPDLSNAKPAAASKRKAGVVVTSACIDRVGGTTAPSRAATGPT